MILSSSKPTLWAGMGIALIALVIGLGAGFKTGLNAPLVSDARQFMNVAESLASGNAYVDKGTFWPDQPSMQRLPAWPLLMATGIKLLPFAPPDAVARTVCLVLNATAAVLLFMLGRHLTGSILPGLIAGLAYAIHPTGLYFAINGLSEMLFLVLVCGGILLLLKTHMVHRLSGALLLGCACLARANFVLALPIAIAVATTAALAGRKIPLRANLTVLLLGFALFCLPSALWLARNHHVSGRFPLFSTLGGQTLYGANNSVTANDLGFWGYWVFPNAVPGERPLAELAQTMGEAEVDQYYVTRGRAYIRDHALAMPRLLLGKLIRGYVPMPWKPSLGAYAVAGYRWLLYLGAAIGLCVGWRQLSSSYRTLWMSMLLTNLVTVLLFYGSTRFSFAFEPFLLPFFGIGAVHLLGRWFPRVQGA
ncbi:MAG: hypothetical protein HN919_00940 [Verrucomicrobia bacterium]|jgi:hypothetical protein|nr:hypothetical protein [Verrucomicrobiota bacterium]